MNIGALLLEKQKKIGIRPIVEAIDEMRMYLGNDNVTVLTPRAEERIRKGIKAQINMKVRLFFEFESEAIFTCLDINFPWGFPELPWILELPENIDKSSHYNTSGELFQLSTENIKNMENYLSENSSGNISGLSNVMTAIKQIQTFISLSFTQKDILCKNNDVNQLSETLEEECEKSESFMEECEKNSFATCKMCRNELFCVDELTSHSHTVFNSERLYNSKCTSIFLSEPPSWLVIGEETQGKLYCHSCDFRVGQWSWVGSKCSCGVWESPAFQFTVSKIDHKVRS